MCWDGIAVGIAPWVPERRIEPLHIISGESMLVAVRLSVQPGQGNPSLVGEISLPQAMSADHVQRTPLAVGRQMEVLTVCLDQAFALEASDEREEVAVGHSQHTCKRLKGRSATPMLGVEEVLERIVHQLARTTGASPLQ
jgi:hypothetical protein